MSQFTFDTTALALARYMAADESAGMAASGGLYLALYEHQTPGGATEEVLTYLRSAVVGGREPHFDLTPNFFYPIIAAAVAVARRTPTVWDRLTDEEREKFDWLMRGFSVMSAIGTDDAQMYHSGPGLCGNYYKTWNPNYRLSNVTPILFAVSYFDGAEAVDRILAQFDYDTYIEKFREYGWTNALARWSDLLEGKYDDPDGDGRATYQVITCAEDVGADEYGNLGLGLKEGEERTVRYTSPRTMMMEGGEIFIANRSLARISQYIGKPAGTGIGVPAIGKKGYVYQEHPLSDVVGIWETLVRFNYSGGPCLSGLGEGEYAAYIEGHLQTPYEGIDGMMKEFYSGKRSSVGYCREDFNLVMTAMAALDMLGLYDLNAPENESLARLVWIGNNDLIFKAEKGYYSFSGTAVRGKPHLDRENNSNGYQLWKSLWQKSYADRYTLADFKK